jgi:DNA-directed RNA polymerase subunit RPC12/RpoP
VSYQPPLACPECGRTLPRDAQFDEDRSCVECPYCRSVGPLEEAVVA